MTKGQTRPYQSQLRERQASDTRRRIVEAARRLLESRGYAETTIEAIAREAGVSAPTVYAVFRSKAGILAELIEQASFGAEYQELVRKALETEEPAKRLRFAARIARQIYDSQSSMLELLRGAGALAPDLAQFERERECDRYESQKRMITYLSTNGFLRPGLMPTAARDILWTLTSRDIYRMFIKERGWTPQQYEDWVGDTLVSSLIMLPSDKRATGSRPA
jgi:AcrR family transcriptional regulator